MKFSIVFLTSLMFASTLCFAEDIQISTNEPEDKDLGMKIDMSGRDFVERITVDKNKFLLVDQSFTDVRVIKDAKDNLNKFSALVSYSLYIDGVKNPPTSALFTDFIYVKCPITRRTSIDRSEVIEERAGSTRLSIKSDALKEELLYPGAYSFLSLPEKRVPALSKNFPMVGKVSQHFDIELMCTQIEIVYLRYTLAEANRGNILKRFGISE